LNEKLTIDKLKSIGRYYGNESTLMGNYLNSTFKGGMSFATAHALIIQNIVNSYKEKDLKYFLNNHLMKLTKKDLRELLSIKNLYYDKIVYEISKVLYDVIRYDKNPIKINFLILYIWRIGCLACEVKKEFELYLFKDLFDDYSCYYRILGQLKNKEIRDEILSTFENLDNLDYISKDEFKKCIFEIKLNIY